MQTKTLMTALAVGLALGLLTHAQAWTRAEAHAIAGCWSYVDALGIRHYYGSASATATAEGDAFAFFGTFEASASTTHSAPDHDLAAWPFDTHADATSSSGNVTATFGMMFAAKASARATSANPLDTPVLDHVQVAEDMCDSPPAGGSSSAVSAMLPSLELRCDSTGDFEYAGPLTTYHGGDPPMKDVHLSDPTVNLFAVVTASGSSTVTLTNHSDSYTAGAPPSGTVATGTGTAVLGNLLCAAMVASAAT